MIFKKYININFNYRNIKSNKIVQLNKAIRHLRKLEIL